MQKENIDIPESAQVWIDFLKENLDDHDIRCASVVSLVDLIGKETAFKILDGFCNMNESEWSDLWKVEEPYWGPLK